MCPIIYFLALAFADNIFHPKLVEAGLSVHRCFTCPSGRSMIEFRFRDDIADTPIFRPSLRGFSGKQADLSRALAATRMRSWMSRLGERAGFPHPLMPYCLRREVATFLAGSSILRLWWDLRKQIDCLGRCWCKSAAALGDSQPPKDRDIH